MFTILYFCLLSTILQSTILRDVIAISK